jgi:hypothetical protein
VAEKDLARVTVGYPAKVMPKAFPEVRLGARVRSVSAVPVAAGRFDAVLDLAEEHPRLSAGMEAEVRVIAESRPDALAVPKKAVFSEPLDDDARFVYVAVEGQEPRKRSVAVGRANDEFIEIAAGLSLGEVILTEKPKADEKPTGTAKPTGNGESKAAEQPADAKPPAADAKPAVAPPAAPAKG